MKQSIQHNPAPSATLRSLRRKLAAAVTPPQLRQAALAIMDAYSQLYPLPSAKAMLLLLSQAAAGQASPRTRQRKELKTFCSFTALLVEAVAILVGEGN